MARKPRVHQKQSAAKASTREKGAKELVVRKVQPGGLQVARAAMRFLYCNDVKGFNQTQEQMVAATRMAVCTKYGPK